MVFLQLLLPLLLSNSPSFSYIFCAITLGEKNSTEVVVIIRSPLFQAWGGSIGGWGISHRCWGLVLVSSISGGSQPILLWTCVSEITVILASPSWRHPLPDGLNINQYNPENEVLWWWNVFSKCHYIGAHCPSCVVDEHLWQVYISVISHSERTKHLPVPFYIKVSLILTATVSYLSMVCNSCLWTSWHFFIHLFIKLNMTQAEIRHTLQSEFFSFDLSPNYILTSKHHKQMAVVENYLLLQNVFTHNQHVWVVHFTKCLMAAICKV